MNGRPFPARQLWWNRLVTRARGRGFLTSLSRGQFHHHTLTRHTRGPSACAVRIDTCSVLVAALAAYKEIAPALRELFDFAQDWSDAAARFAEVPRAVELPASVRTGIARSVSTREAA